ncbi:MarR family transcriptional regulator [Curtobacterium flaccumfaciens]|nr:MarR family transcriptional regulator [Curtobacterium flaccumfaciens]
MNRLIRTAAQATGNTTSSAVWRTLGILETDQPLRLGELAAASRVAQPTMTRLVAGMLADGLISRSVDPATRAASSSSSPTSVAPASSTGEPP